MPDQPDDPIHYDMKIPPEPKDAPLNNQQQDRGSDDVTRESNELHRSSHTGSDDPSQSGGRPQ